MRRQLARRWTATLAAIGLGFGLTSVFDLDFAGLGTPFILTIAIYAGIELIALIGRPFVGAEPDA